MGTEDNRILNHGDSAMRATGMGPRRPADTPDESVARVKAIAERFFEGARGSHDWEHTLRVHRLCTHIGPIEGADMEVLLIASYLHDIGRCHQDASDGAVCHAEKGAEMAWPLIRELRLDGGRKENIVHCIRAHRFRGDCAPQTLEAKVLFDADKLDAIGAVGIARAYLFAGELGAKLHNADVDVEATAPYSREDTGFREYAVKLCKIKDRMLTGEGKRMARDRHAFMEAFFKRFHQEYEGKR
jgi:uncharacterized protein